MAWHSPKMGPPVEGYFRRNKAALGQADAPQSRPNGTLYSSSHASLRERIRRLRKTLPHGALSKVFHGTLTPHSCGQHAGLRKSFNVRVTNPQVETYSYRRGIRPRA